VDLCKKKGSNYVILLEIAIGFVILGTLPKTISILADSDENFPSDYTFAVGS